MSRGQVGWRSRNIPDLFRLWLSLMERGRFELLCYAKLSFIIRVQTAIVIILFIILLYVFNKQTLMMFYEREVSFRTLIIF